MTENYRWEDTDAFVAACNAFNAIDDAKKELGYRHRLDASIEDVNTLQDLLIQQGYAIQKIKQQ